MSPTEEPKLNFPKLEINVPLLRKTLEHIHAHPEEHIQTCWAIQSLDTECGTAFCVAGHAVQFAGHEIKWSGDLFGSYPNEAFHVADGETIQDTARRELGLNDQQARQLFSMHNSRQLIFWLANEYTNGEIEIPEEYL